jgi:hypothetical protein
MYLFFSCGFIYLGEVNINSLGYVTNVVPIYEGYGFCEPDMTFSYA